MNDQISPRELEILHLVAYEHNTKEIAKELFISEHTVISHRKNLLIKMDVKNTAGLVRKGFEIGLLALKNGTSVAFVMFFLCFSQFSFGQCNNADFQALKDLYGSTNGNSWTNTGAWALIKNNSSCPTGADLGSLPGVSLNTKGRVSKLELINRNLTGSLSTTLNLLSELEVLNLSRNNISGNIPASIGAITTLDTLELQRNDLTGSIPITGSNFLNLKTLNLSNNDLTGGIPDQIGSLSSLSTLLLHRNDLRGTIPYSLGTIPTLTTMWISHDSITGCFPTSFYNLCIQLTDIEVDPGNDLDATFTNTCFFGSGVCPPEPFITTWNTNNFTSGGLVPGYLKIPTYGGGYNYDVDWDMDGVYDTLGVTDDLVINFGAPGINQIAIRGEFPRIYLANSGEEEKLESIDQWGDIEWTSMENAFAGCSNMTIVATDAPDLRKVSSLSRMFQYCSSLDSDLSHWKVDSVTDMSYMFGNATSFTSDLSAWQVGRVADMSFMFLDADSFDQNLSNWDVSSVTNMSYMFAYADVFNSPLSWGDKTSNVISMPYMFAYADNFNQNISDWNVSSVTDMKEMFRKAIEFDQDLSLWQVDSVEDMSGMLRDADNFNSPIDWGSRTSNVKDMKEMFRGADKFNQAISSWDVSAVENMNGMFAFTDSFNQNISAWIVSDVTDMTDMFWRATAFDYSLGSWDITNVEHMEGMLDDSNLSIYNYDQTLIGWASQQVQSNVVLGATGLTYCLSATERALLEDQHMWDITGDTQDAGVNTIVLSGTGSWIDSVPWSLGRPPSFCNDVVLDHEGGINIFPIGVGATLEIAEGTELLVIPGATLIIGATEFP